jgi:hypothetical protein
MNRSEQHPIVKTFADRWRKRGAAIYAGRNFMVATWQNGNRFEVWVDQKPTPSGH